MRELAVHLVGDRALLQHDNHIAGLFGNRRDMQVDQPLARHARCTEVDLVFVDCCAAAADLIDQREQRSSERDEIAQDVPTQQGRRHIEELLGRRIGVANLPVRSDDDHRMRQRIEHGFGAAPQEHGSR